MTEKQQKFMKLFMEGILLCSMFFLAGKFAGGMRQIENDRYVSAMAEGSRETRPCVVIDAGHGGADPGKIGVNQVLEKDVNLEIAKKLKKFLEAADVRVVMTRKDDSGLYEENASNKKVQDMKNRIRIIDESRPSLVVSIHQNSYRQEGIRGAQVFFYQTSAEGEEMAKILQENLQKLDEDNRRKPKGNTSYYLLKKTAYPIVIVECGFLSNPEEAEKLATPYYQEKLAWNIHMGILQYLNTAGRQSGKTARASQIRKNMLE